ncbi:MAG: translation initiation factor IF-2 [Candidatus Micrarchaeia archaeon]|jgi:translation initiation factor 5B
MIRQPIVTVMGHVDHGKTSLLDCIRKTTIAKKEHGAITQHIGASEVPKEVIEEICSPILSKLGAKLKIPGILFLDTPGHEAFINLRKRGGSISDFVIVVVDINEGFKQQTFEVINILKFYKTPFLIAANKVDLITGWIPSKTLCIEESLSLQNSQTLQRLDEKIYSIVAQLANEGFNSERFDRVKDLTKEVVIIPTSAKTREGIAELLAFIAGLSQKFLENRLKIEVSGEGKGSILETKEEKGFGTTIDIILYDGTIKVGDEIAFFDGKEIKITKVKGILHPKPFVETRTKVTKGKFESVKMVSAAAGIKIIAQNLEGAVPGSPVFVVHGEKDEKINEIKAEVEKALQGEGEGIIVKGDTIGSLEALRYILSKKTKIASFGLGSVTKEDISLATTLMQKNPKYGIIVCFNVKVEKEIKEECERRGIKLIATNVIYEISEALDKTLEKIKEEEAKKVEESIVMPAQIKVLPFCFRYSNPAIFGIRVEVGKIKPGYELMNEEGRRIGRIKSIQSEKISLNEAKEGQEVAIAVEDATFGRHFRENSTLFTIIPREHIQLLFDKYNYLLDEKLKELLLKIRNLELKS